MPKYSYQALSSDGDSVTGELNAATAESVANQLRQSGSLPLTITEVIEKTPGWRQLRYTLGLDKPSIDELILFCRQCYALNRAGVPIIRGFRLLAGSYRNPIFAEAIQEVVSDLEAGRELSAAMSRHRALFSPLFVNVIRVGETSGHLDQAFLQLHSYFESDRETINQVKAALRYPAFVLTALVIAVFIIMTFVIPKFTDFYATNKLNLPLPTQIIIGISDFMVNYWYLLFGGLGLIFFSFNRYIQTAQGRLWWDRLKLRFWVFGDIVSRALLGRFARTLALSLSAGVPILQAISVTAQAIGNEYMAVKITGMRDSIERGESLLKAANRQKIFTPIVLQMIAVGEESGRVEELLEEIAGFYEREVAYDVKNINALLEPVLTVGVAALVLLLLLGVVLPMWNVVEMVN